MRRSFTRAGRELARRGKVPGLQSIYHPYGKGLFSTSSSKRPSLNGAGEPGKSNYEDTHFGSVLPPASTPSSSQEESRPSADVLDVKNNGEVKPDHNC